MSGVNQDGIVQNVERGTIFDNPSRLSRIFAQSSLPSDNEMKEHFRICLKLYTENKISAKNVWNLKLIDYLRNLLISKSQEENTSLQVAGTSLDVGTKIYVIRVDDIHSDGMRVASNMLRVNPQQEPDEHITNNNSQNQENKAPKRKKAGQQAMISKNQESLLGDIPKVPSTVFEIRNDSQLNLTSNLFTNTVPIHHVGFKFMLLSEEKWWQAYKFNKTFPKKEYKFFINKFDFTICTPFSEFEIDEWDFDRENDQINKMNQVLDCDIAPFYELDEPLLNDLNHEQHEDGEVEEELDYIVNFHPKAIGRLANDYSFINLHNNKVMNRLWAGPSHWKLKYLQPRSSKFSGKLKKRSSKKKRRINDIINFELDFPKVDTKLYKPKVINSYFDPIKCTLPQKIYLENKNVPLMLKPLNICNTFWDKNTNRATSEDVANNSRNHSFGSGFQDNALDSNIHEEVNLCRQQRRNMDCLVDAPEMVENVYLPHSLNDKKMDMKELKRAVWKTLQKVEMDQSPSNEVEKQLYSEMYKKLPKHLPKKMQDNLTCPLAFVSLLHLADERHLEFEKIEKNDFSIEQQNEFVREN